jgi:hypothetical protein
MGDLSPSESACKERPCLSGSILTNFLKLAKVWVAKPIRCFSSHHLLPRYGSSAGSLMREEMRLYLIENTLATHLEDETSQTKIRA